eukprot:gnl/Spiro4/22943_TR11324_c0_g1_i1.p4 gnl/Spiro4/22943_TR11324_c0_g1~~gnl/Spiro4/22943_TR11324_c0_g1_i1.p4  ORF type:complete len:138 (+),score=13.60 gnl/Spiro4/22943_TR11324_c0_g1_i1:140-553(+)
MVFFGLREAPPSTPQPSEALPFSSFVGPAVAVAGLEPGPALSSAPPWDSAPPQWWAAYRGFRLSHSIGLIFFGTLVCITAYQLRQTTPGAMFSFSLVALGNVLIARQCWTPHYDSWLHTGSCVALVVSWIRLKMGIV